MEEDVGAVSADETDDLRDELAARLGEAASGSVTADHAVPDSASQRSAGAGGKDGAEPTEPGHAGAGGSDGVDSSYRVERVLKESPVERTELVWFRGAGGGELGPFVRKRIREGSGVGGAYRQLWAAERGGRRFSHLPHVVSCVDDERGLTVLLDWVSGPTLRELVRATEPDGRLELASRLMPAVADAVAELHEAFDEPLIHRDLTPGNVVCSSAGPVSPVLIDLGIARTWRSSAAEDTTHFGTRAYAPPEQFGFGQTDVRSDVYALGMLALFCLTGRDPTPADRDRGFAVPGVPEPWRRMIARACEFDPAGRYPSVRELAAAFRRVGASRADAGAPGPAERGPRGVEAVPTAEAAIVPWRPTADEAAPDPWRATAARALSLARNALALFFSLALTVVSLSMSLDPGSYTGRYPAWYEAFVYVVTVPVLFLSLGYLLLDKRRLRARVGALRDRTWRQDVRLVVAVVAVDLALLMVLYLLGVPR